LSFKYKSKYSNNDNFNKPVKEKKPCCQKMGRLLNFFAISVWVSYYFKIMMFKKAGISTDDISLLPHVLLFIVLIVPGIYLTKFKNKKK